jgi:hypothetical protein
VVEIVKADKGGDVEVPTLITNEVADHNTKLLNKINNNKEIKIISIKSAILLQVITRLIPRIEIKQLKIEIDKDLFLLGVKVSKLEEVTINDLYNLNLYIIFNNK